jgi:hypothetical protein
VSAPARTRGFAADAERHRRDAPRYCPRCGADVSSGGAGIAVEYWEAAERVFHTWCAACDWTGDIVPTAAGEVTSHEPEH